MVISAAKTTEKEILLDVDEATKMLRLLQYKDDDPLFFVVMVKQIYTTHQHQQMKL